MQWELGASSSIFGGLTEADLAACGEAGVKCLEMCLFGRAFDAASRVASGAASGTMDPYFTRLASQAAAEGLTFWSVHLPFGRSLDISLLDDQARRTVVQSHGDLLEAAARLAPKKAVVHASSEPVVPDQREARLAACRESLVELSARASALGIQLAVECLPRTCLGNTASEMKAIIEGIDALGVCCDTNHLLKEPTEAFILDLGSKVVTLHVSDYDRVDERHWMPGRGVNDWKAIIASLSSVGYCGPIMFEVSQANADRPTVPADLRRCWDGLLTTQAPG